MNKESNLARDMTSSISETSSLSAITSDAATSNSDNGWSRADIMSLSFGLVTVVFTIFAVWIAWVGFIKDRRKEIRKSKNRRKAEETERAEEVSRRVIVGEKKEQEDIIPNHQSMDVNLEENDQGGLTETNI